MNSRPELRIGWCGYDAAKYAVINWHYSRKMPTSKLARLGAWENGTFVGALIFGTGATPEIIKPFGLRKGEVCELVRVAMKQHAWPVSRMLSIAVRMLQAAMPGIRLIVSFADTAQGHHGGIYQAAGWHYLGEKKYHAYRIHGQTVHPRTLYSRYGVGGQSIGWLRQHIDINTERITTDGKHKYVLPIDKSLAGMVRSMSKPYPKRRKQSGDAAGDQPAEGGSIPTPPLQLPAVT